MIMNESLYPPTPTCDIPMPILEGQARATAGELALPRVLRQAAGMRSASRRVLFLTAIFLALSVLEGALLVRLRVADPLVFYHDLPRRILLESQK